MELQNIVAALEKIFREEADADKAAKMKKYMRNQFDFLGLPQPVRKKVSKTFWTKNELPEGEDFKCLIKLLWNQPYREMQYHALDLLVKQKKQLNIECIPFLLELVQDKSWWDTIDIIAPTLIGSILLQKPKKIADYSEEWIKDVNIWLQRTALLFQLKYKEKTEIETLFVTIAYSATSKEFFVQKAAGWALREYSKTNAQAVSDFIQKNSHQLSNLTIKEGSKYLKNK